MCTFCGISQNHENYSNISWSAHAELSQSIARTSDSAANLGTDDYRIQALLGGDFAPPIVDNPGTPVTLYYTFDAPAANSNGFTGPGEKLNGAMHDTIREILGKFEAVANIDFIEGARPNARYTDEFGNPLFNLPRYGVYDYDLSFQQFDNGGNQNMTASYWPSTYNSMPLTNGAYTGGYVEISTQVQEQGYAPGQFGYYVALHEIAHSFGLKHPGNYTSFDTGPFLPENEDNMNNTVLSYNGDGGYVSELGPYDILTLQYLFGPADGSTDGGNETVSSATNDNIVGTNGSDELFGGAGFDSIDGGDGNDTLFGGVGIVDPNDQSDSMLGGGGDDILYGNTGDDSMFGGRGLVDANDGNDTLYGGFGADFITGNSGNDSVYGGGSIADPNDLGDELYGGKGADQLYGNGGDDVIYGGGSLADPEDQADLVNGGVGNDRMFGNGGNDTIQAGYGFDSVNGGVGADRIELFEFEGTHGVNITGYESGNDVLVFIGFDASANDIFQAIQSGNGIITHDGGSLSISVDSSLSMSDILVM